ncbi:hypothetical protein IEN85_10450 [Pelagicoccus sp. NFK12]|uniref:DUF3108 domain-containing protein n=1 Tax=Pelagicoccus enzymogenes TaxID=2773457 RepID=A0A927IHP1_9BACT|nr:hypothetical protein [Pelagicoccus enzymogenes]MBD5779908.1 hypothetical protein [Pelagicoccus enzymogenes]
MLQSPLTHPPLQRALVWLGLACLAANPLSAAKQDGEEILRHTLNLYGSAGYISCDVQIQEEVEVYVNSIEFERGFETERITLVHTASLQYTRPDLLFARWNIVDGSQQIARTGSISTAEDIYILAHQYPQKPELTEEPDQYENLNQAIDYSEFSSFRFTAVLRDFFDPSFHGDLLANDIELVGTRKLGKLRCHVLKIEGYKSMTLWIDRKNYALCRIDYATDYGTLQGEAAWLDWKLNQAQLSLDPQEARIQRRINLYRDPPEIRPDSCTIVFQGQNIQP